MFEGALLQRLSSTPAMSAVWSDGARVQGILSFERALAEAAAECGLIPASAVPSIVASCDAALFDIAEIGEAAGRAGNLAIPIVAALTARVSETDPAAAHFVHWGATSQDAQDTGTVLQVMRAAPLLLADLDRLRAGLAALARTHADTVMIGRTWLQQAAPITFGLKAAGYLSAVDRARTAVIDAVSATRVIQFGGAVGTLASLGAEGGQRVAEALARRLNVARPALPWHADRTRVAALGASLGLVIGAIGKIAVDFSLLAQTEIGEVREPGGSTKGGSSTMPHKRNPVGSAIALSAAVQAPGLVATLFVAMNQEHERGLGGWHAEWDALPALFRLAAAAADAMADVCAGLEIDGGRMASNLAATGGLILAESVSMALASHIGREAAHRLVERSCRRATTSGETLAALLCQDEEVTRYLTARAVEDLLRPEHYLGAARAFIDGALAADAALPAA